MYKKIFSLALLLGSLILGSCSEEGYWTKFSPDTKAQYSLTSSTSKFSYTPSEVPEVINLTIRRSISSGMSELPIVAKFKSDKISCPDKVTFADGSYEAILPISIAKGLEAGTYTGSISLPDSSYLSSSGVLVSSFSLSVEYIWSDWSVGILHDKWNKVDNENVKIIKADGASVYRIIKPFYNASVNAWWQEEGEISDEDKKKVTCDYIEFAIDEDGNVTYDTFLFMDYNYSKGLFVYGYHPLDAGEDYVNYAPYNKLLSDSEVQFAPVMIVPGEGAYGVKQFIFELTEDDKTF